MSKLRVLTYPDPFLKTIASPVIEFDATLKQVTEDMIETMYESSGIGLAATQVGENKRLFVMDVQFKPDDEDSTQKPMIIINPEITEPEGESYCEEGCLSVPEVRAEVKRIAQLTLKYQDAEGNQQTLAADGITAICIQHEIDHLEGKLFIDYLPLLKRKMVQKKLKKQSERNA